MQAETLVITLTATANELKEAICEMLEWSEEQYANYQFEQGIAYIMLYMPCCEKTRLKLQQSASFWGWWKLNWTRMDEVFFNEPILKVNTNHRRIMYKGIQAGYAKIQDIRIPSVITDNLIIKTTNLCQA